MLVLSGCASSPDYVHSPETHHRHVEAELAGPHRVTRTHLESADVRFDIRPDGTVANIRITGGNAASRVYIRALLRDAEPFAAHTAGGPITYSTSVVFRRDQRQ